MNLIQVFKLFKHGGIKISKPYFPLAVLSLIIGFPNAGAGAVKIDTALGGYALNKSRPARTLVKAAHDKTMLLLPASKTFLTQDGGNSPSRFFTVDLKKTRKIAPNFFNKPPL